MGGLVGELLFFNFSDFIPTELSSNITKIDCTNIAKLKDKLTVRIALKVLDNFSFNNLKFYCI